MSHTIRRWINWAATTAIVAAAGYVLLPLLRRYPGAVHEYFESAGRWPSRVALFLFSLCAVQLLFKLFVPKIAHLRRVVALKHPPIWSALLASTLIVCLLDLVLGLGTQSYEASIWDWIAYGFGPIALIASYGPMTSYLSKPNVVPKPEPEPTFTLDDLKDWPTIKIWLMRETPADEDLLGNRRIAVRLANRLQNEGSTIGLIGPFGSGKSSIIRWIKEHVESEHQKHSDTAKILFADVSCWGFEDSAAAVKQILATAMETVGREADCFSLRSLPESYRKTFSAGGDWVRSLFDLVIGAEDPMKQFRQLEEILASINARLVLVIEDLDRTNTAKFDRQEVLALLHRVRGIDPYRKPEEGRLTFILATGNASATDIDFAKLCDHFERLPEIDESRVAELVSVVRHRCLNSDEFPYIALDADGSNPWDPELDLLPSHYDIVTEGDALLGLVRTPRSLKHVLRRTYTAWQCLYGEVDFDHLLGVNILRFGAPEALDFLNRNWDQLQKTPTPENMPGLDKQPQIATRLTEAWRAAMTNVDYDRRFAERLLNFLVPTTNHWIGIQKRDRDPRLQGIWPSEFGSKYLGRILNEDINADDVLDQKVLVDIDDWSRSRSAASALVDGMYTSIPYTMIWKRFAKRKFFDDASLLLQLTEQLLDRYRFDDSKRVLIHRSEWLKATARCGSGSIRKSNNLFKWFITQLEKSILCDLDLTNELYYEWCEVLIRDNDDRMRLRKQVLDLAKLSVKDGETLLRLLRTDRHYQVYQLVYDVDKDSQALGLDGPQHWSWLGPVLLSAMRINPVKMGLEIGALIRDRDERYERDGPRIDLDSFKAFFGDDGNEVIRMLAVARDLTTGVEQKGLAQLVASCPISSS